jgi:RHS repeat-associated protein
MAGGNAVETLYFNRMWSWRYGGLTSDLYGRNSKHIYVGGSRIVTKVSRADGSQTMEERKKQYYYHSDHLGSAQLISNWKGEEYERMEYTPYGELWIERAGIEDQIDIPYRFTGKERDSETGLYYYGARYLDSKAGRWLSTDPALGEYIPEAPIDEEARKRNGNLPGMGGIYNTVNSHLYHYAGNNPLKYTDPDGKTTIYNFSSNYIIIRDEDGRTHAVQPGERYLTEAHGVSAIDGILLHNGSSYKTNDGNDFTTFIVIEDNEGYKIVETIGNLIRDKLIDITKSLRNKAKPNDIPLDYSGMHEKDDGSILTTEWRETANKAYSDDYAKANGGKLPDKNLKDMSREEWNTSLINYKKHNPDGK